MSYMLALDQGTTSSRAIIFNHRGEIVAVDQQEFEQLFPRSGWVEHRPEDIWQSQIRVAQNVLIKAGIQARDVMGIGITNQRETTLIWEKSTGKPIANAIVWQDRRTSELCDTLKSDQHEALFRQRTGLVLDPYFSGTKIRWLLDAVPDARAHAENGELAFGTVDSWLVWNLTGGKCHVTDASNASRTLLFNLETDDWDDELLDLLQVPRVMMPKVCPSSLVYGHTAPGLFDAAIPIAGIAGDQQAALFGQMCIHPGMVKNTYGTGCFMLLHTGDKKVASNNNLLSTVAWKIGDKTEYALEGSVFIAGALVQWLRDGIGLIKSSPEIEPLAASVEDNGGVYIVPAFAGLGAPHWDPHARGIIAGLTRGVNAGHIARAALEGIAYQVADVLESMIADSGVPITELRVDGGAAANNLLMQFQANILNTPIVRPKVLETTALGAAYLAGLATGYWDSLETIENQRENEQRFEPAMEPTQRNKLRLGWQKALERSRRWSEE